MVPFAASAVRILKGFFLSFRRFDRGYVNYDQLTQIAGKEGFTHQMKNIDIPNKHILDTIMTHASFAIIRRHLARVEPSPSVQEAAAQFVHYSYKYPK